MAFVNTITPALILFLIVMDGHFVGIMPITMCMNGAVCSDRRSLHSDPGRSPSGIILDFNAQQDISQDNITTIQHCNFHVDFREQQAKDKEKEHA